MVEELFAQALAPPLDLTRRIVVIDTYVFRWLATARLKGACDLAALSAVYRRLPTPDVSLRLRLDPERALERIQARPRGDRVMDHTALLRLSEYDRAFDEVQEHLPYSHRCIDAAQPSSAVIDALLEALRAADP